MTDYQRSTGWVCEFKGVIAASVTPFADDGSVSIERIPALVDFLIERGVDGIMVGGTTGEFVTMTPSERVAALSAFVEAGDHRVPIIAHVGAADPNTARQLTTSAASVGADAIVAMTPQFFPSTNAAIERYFGEIASTAPELPLLVYEFPARAGNTTSPLLFERLLELPNLAGIKVSAERLEEITDFLTFEPDILVVCGNDSLQADFIAQGGRAIVSGNAAVYPEVSRAVFDALMDDAEGTVERSTLDDLAILSRAGSPDRLKELLRDRGVDAGIARCRTYLPSDPEFPSGVEIPESVADLLIHGPRAR